MEFETFYSDIKDVGNVKIPMMRTVKLKGRIPGIKIDKVELNVPIDEKIFEKQ